MSSSKRVLCRKVNSDGDDTTKNNKTVTDPPALTESPLHWTLTLLFHIIFEIKKFCGKYDSNNFKLSSLRMTRSYHIIRPDKDWMKLICPKASCKRSCESSLHLFCFVRLETDAVINIRRNRYGRLVSQLILLLDMDVSEYEPDLPDRPRRRDTSLSRCAKDTFRAGTLRTHRQKDHYRSDLTTNARSQETPCS
ncbi:hypothetical protein T02_4875 [Trichinella nativa]|uniref:Uncharacterized protein n=1 Tax=Trichinella nativa TaxID=6335 RepID=A0A0V1L5A4_9BILA|nr:hypothetical protein T02_4875 [Trichinella nativa]